MGSIIVMDFRCKCVPPLPAPNKLWWACHTDLQGPPYFWHHQLWPCFSAAPLGSPSLPSHPDFEPSPAVNNQSATLRGGATQWRLRFQLNPPLTSRNKSPNFWELRQPPHLGPPWVWQLVFRSRSRTLSLPPTLCSKDQSRAQRQNSAILSTPMPSAKNILRWCSHHRSASPERGPHQYVLLTRSEERQ